MGKFSGVLLATDYDDTLYDSKGTISPENRAAIDRFLAEGGLFSISTGRSYINFVIQMEREKLPVNAPVDPLQRRVDLRLCQGGEPLAQVPAQAGARSHRQALCGLPGAGL